MAQIPSLIVPQTTTDVGSLKKRVSSSVFDEAQRRVHTQVIGLALRLGLARLGGGLSSPTGRLMVDVLQLIGGIGALGRWRHDCLGTSALLGITHRGTFAVSTKDCYGRRAAAGLTPSVYSIRSALSHFG